MKTKEQLIEYLGKNLKMNYLAYKIVEKCIDAFYADEWAAVDDECLPLIPGTKVLFKKEEDSRVCQGVYCGYIPITNLKGDVIYKNLFAGYLNGVFLSDLTLVLADENLRWKIDS